VYGLSFWTQHLPLDQLCGMPLGSECSALLHSQRVGGCFCRLQKAVLIPVDGSTTHLAYWAHWIAVVDKSIRKACLPQVHSTGIISDNPRVPTYCSEGLPVYRSN
jgi:hypothetical protein